MFEVSNSKNLIVDLQSTSGTVLKITPWESGLKVFYKYNTTWEEDPSPISFPIINFIQQSQYAWWLNKIPSDVLHIAENFNLYQFDILRYCSKNREIVSFCEGNKGLLWAIMALDIKLEYAVSKGYKRLCKEIYGDGSKATIKFLKKIKPIGMFDLFHPIIKNVIEEDSKQDGHAILGKLNHLQEIDPRILKVYMLSNSLLEKLMIEIKTHPVNRTLRDIQLLINDTCENIKNAYHPQLWAEKKRQLLSIKELDKFYEFCRSMNERMVLINDTRRMDNEQRDILSLNTNDLVRLHDVLAVNYNNSVDSNTLYGPFPPSPIPFEMGLEPIVCASELAIEGAMMGHCVASYHNKVIHKRAYIYRVLSPQRSTVEIAFSDKVGTWVIKQVRGRHNSIVDPAVTELIEDRIRKIKS